MKIQIEKTSKEIKKLKGIGTALLFVGFGGGFIHPILFAVAIVGSGVYLTGAAKQWWEHA